MSGRKEQRSKPGLLLASHLEPKGEPVAPPETAHELGVERRGGTRLRERSAPRYGCIPTAGMAGLRGGVHYCSQHAISPVSVPAAQ